MESRYTVHIAPAEWRWAIIAATALVLLAFVPFIWVAVADTGNWQFMGALHNYMDASTYIAKMMQGVHGVWLIGFLHTPEPHNGALIPALYPTLGHLARLTSLPVIVMYHVGRVGAALFMYLALYSLAASVWQRVHARRVFFVVASVGSGLGWLFAPLLGAPATEFWPDLQIPEAFPFFSTLVNVHFPLTIACLALLVSLIVTAFRPGAEGQRDVGRSMPLAVLLSIILSFVYPQALVPLGLALVAYVALVWWDKRRHVTGWLARWVLAVGLSALPMAFYYYFVVTENSAFAEWSRQNINLAPGPHILLLGLGIPLLLALPALGRAVRRFEQVDDRLMLLWLLAFLVCVYLPTGIQRRFMVGMMIPVAYFATRALEDVWLRRVGRRSHGVVLGLVVALMSVSNLLVLFLPVLPVVTGERTQMQMGAFLDRDYALAFRWLESRTGLNDVVLASPAASVWIPAWAGTHVVFGHPFETLEAADKRAQVEAWYSSGDDCAALIDRYNIRYVLVGPEERALGPASCLETLTPMVAFGQVGIYAP